MEAATTSACPACTFPHDDGDESCARCGIVFAKARSGPPPVVPLEIEPVVVPRPVPSPWSFVGVALIAAVLAHAFPVTRFVLSPLVTLLHEFGHAVAAWLLGRPALPAFDFVYGGGITHQGAFRLPLAIGVGGLLAWLGWTFRRNRRTLSLIVVVAAAWLAAVRSEWSREIVVAAMGHGTELILAGVLLFMALSGSGWRIPEIERPLGAVAAFFVQIQTMKFAWDLRHDPDFLAWYLDGKGGALMNDLEVIALDVHIWTGWPVDVERVAGWLFAFAFVPIAVALGLYLFRDRVRTFARSLLLLEP